MRIILFVFFFVLFCFFVVYCFLLFFVVFFFFNLEILNAVIVTFHLYLSFL